MLERLREAAGELRVRDRILEVPSHAPSSVAADTLALRSLLALDLLWRPFTGLGLLGHQLHRKRLASNSPSAWQLDDHGWPREHLVLTGGGFWERKRTDECACRGGAPSAVREHDREIHRGCH